MNQIKLSYRHDNNNKNHKLSDLGKVLNNPCSKCSFVTDMHPDIVTYCLHECPEGRRDKTECNP